MFQIQDYVEFNSKGRAVCPSCAASKGQGHRKLNLSLVPDTDGAYKCHAGCTPQMIKDALGVKGDRQIPAAIAQPTAKVTVSPEQVTKAHRTLYTSDSQHAIAAMNWLKARGITESIVTRYKLGLSRAKVGDRHFPAITIPIPANADGTQYYQKKRVAPWLTPEELPADYKPWSQYGIPARALITWLPAEAQETWICEGEWDAMMLGFAARQADIPVAVGCFTCGCSTVPPADQLALLPGRVVIFYDRNDKPTKQGTIPGDDGARKLAAALGDRAAIGQVPMPDDCQVHGWDVSDALNSGYTIQDFIIAAEQATTPQQPAEKPNINPLREALVTNDALIADAPDYVNWLVEDLLPANEMILLAASPRAGKSLMAMLLAKCIASGEPFLDRPVTQGPVIYIACEDAPVKIKQRELAQGWPEGLPVYWLKRFKLSQIAQLRELAEEIQPVLIVLDTLSRVRDDTVTESSAEMSRTLEPLQELAEDLNCCILPVHHTGKISVDNANLIDVFDTIRGSSAIRATCRGTMVLASNQEGYRLCVETGYAKEDLKIRLDLNTLEWKLLGHWVKPTVNGGQRSEVEDYLNKVGEATFDQIHEATRVPKESLYKVLSRLASDDFLSKTKVGKQNVYTRSQILTLDNTGQSNELSNIQNPDPDSVRVDIGQNNFYLLPNAKSDQVGKSDQTGTSDDCDTLITFGSTRNLSSDLSNVPNASTEGVSGSLDHISLDHPPTTLSNVSNVAGNTSSESVSDIGQTLDKLDKLRTNDRVTIRAQGQFDGKRARVVALHDDGTVEVKGASWYVTQRFQPSELELVNGGNDNA